MMSLKVNEMLIFGKGATMFACMKFVPPSVCHVFILLKINSLFSFFKTKKVRIWTILFGFEHSARLWPPTNVVLRCAIKSPNCVSFALFAGRFWLFSFFFHDAQPLLP